jgi:hypothetical protein
MRTLAAVTALSIFLVQNASAQYAERFSVAGNRVAVFNIAGEVRVEPGTGNAVIIEVIRGGEDSDRLSVKTGEMDDWRTLRVIYPSDRIVYPRLGRWSRSNFSVNEDGTFGGSILRATLDETGFHDTKGLRLSMGRNDVRVSGNGSGLEAWQTCVFSFRQTRRSLCTSASGESVLQMSAAKSVWKPARVQFRPRASMARSWLRAVRGASHSTAHAGTCTSTQAPVAYVRPTSQTVR